MQSALQCLHPADDVAAMLCERDAAVGCLLGLRRLDIAQFCWNAFEFTSFERH